MGFHDKTRQKLENKKMELVIPLDRVNVSLSLSEKMNFFHNRIQSYAYLNFGYNQSSLKVITEKKPFKV